MSLIAELKRRHVIRVALGYAALAWVLVEVSATTFPMLNLPDWAPTLVLLLLMLGFPVALVFAWIYQVTPDGVQKDTGADVSEESTGLSASASRGVVEAAPSDRSIAVLPFVNMSDDPDNEYFSDGLSEELLNLLAKIPELRVPARTSSFQFKGQNLDIGKVAEQLNVEHVLEGSVRKSGVRVRVTAQLIEADTGYHLWSDTYDRDLDDIYAIQDEISAAIVAALSETLGRLRAGACWHRAGLVPDDGKQRDVRNPAAERVAGKGAAAPREGDGAGSRAPRSTRRLRPDPGCAAPL